MGSHAGCSIILGGIPPGTHLRSQVGLAGSHLIFLSGVYASCVRTFVVHFVKLTFNFNANMSQMFNMCTCMFPNILCFLFTLIHFCSVAIEHDSFTFFSEM